MFKPDTVQVPRDIIKEGEPEEVFAAALLMMYPKYDAEKLMEHFPKADDKAMYRMEEYLRDGDAPAKEENPTKKKKKRTKAPKGEYNQKGGGNGNVDYNDPGNAPEEWVDDFREMFLEYFPDSKITNSAIGAIYDKVDGDMEHAELALITTLDYHENQEEVKSPGGLTLRSLGHDTREQLERKVEKIQGGGSNIKREKRLNRAADKARKYTASEDYDVDEGDDDFDV